MFVGERISKYEQLEFLGGGMSLVYRARDTALNRTVAIKILSLAAEPGTRARFLHEAQIVSNIAHENIPAVYDFGEEDGKALHRYGILARPHSSRCDPGYLVVLQIRRREHFRAKVLPIRSNAGALLSEIVRLRRAKEL